MYEPRKYRQEMNRERFRSLVIRENETDLWIGLSPETDPEIIRSSVLRRVKEIRKVISDYIIVRPVFRDALHPLKILGDDPELIQKMKKAGLAAGTGPMASVAGLVAEETGMFILNEFKPEELIVENGGDIFLSVRQEINISVYAGQNKAFQNLGLRVPAGDTPLGICTSSGMFGHSLSLGKADSVTTACKSTPAADARATAIANKIYGAPDVQKALELFSQDMLALVCIKDDTIGVKGRLPLIQIPS